MGKIVNRWEELANRYMVDYGLLCEHIVSKCNEDGYGILYDNIQELEDYLGHYEVLERLVDYISDIRGIDLEITILDNGQFFIEGGSYEV